MQTRIAWPAQQTRRFRLRVRRPFANAARLDSIRLLVLSLEDFMNVARVAGNACCPRPESAMPRR